MAPSLRSLETYNRFISWSRKGILFILGGFFVTLVGWSSLTRVTPIEGNFVNLKSEAVVENHMEKPYFSALSDKGDPYEIWAEKAKNITTEQVDLITPQGKIKDKEGRVMMVEASQGHYTKDKHLLILQKNVRMRDALEGYTLTTNEAFVDMKNQEVQGSLPVNAEGPTGSFWGQSFWVGKKNGDLILNGQAHLVILPQKKSTLQNLPIIIDAEEKIDCKQEKNICMAKKNATAKREDRTIYGDELFVHFSPGKSLQNREVVALEAKGHVHFTDPLRTACGEHAYYVVSSGHMTLTGKNLKILTKEEKLTADRSIEYFDFEKKAVAKGNALFTQGDRVIQADILTAYFKPKRDTSSASPEDPGLVLDHVIVEGHVIISTPHQIARGDHGRYDALTEQAHLKGHTEVVQGKNLIRGTHATVDLKKKTASMQVPPTKDSPRVQAILVPRDLKQQKSLLKKPGHSS